MNHPLTTAFHGIRSGGAIEAFRLLRYSYRVRPFGIKGRRDNNLADPDPENPGKDPVSRWFDLIGRQTIKREHIF